MGSPTVLIKARIWNNTDIHGVRIYNEINIPDDGLVVVGHMDCDKDLILDREGMIMGDMIDEYGAEDNSIFGHYHFCDDMYDIIEFLEV